MMARSQWHKAVFAVLAAALLLMAPRCARAYTQDQEHEIFDILDANHDGKVTRPEFEANKVDAFYFRDRKDPQDPRLRFEETGLSRAFFDRADQGHKGYLTGLDLADAIRFESIDVRHHGYFDFDEFVAALKTISR